MSTKEVKETGQNTKAVPEVKLIPVYVMGKKYMVPETLTIMKALEYAGYRFIRGCGCRGGICGACATVYRKPGDYHLRVGLACQTVVEPDMYLTQIPFYPANRARFDYEKLTAAPEELFALYPEVFRCIACNSCTKVCPMDIPVMDVISAVKQGNIARAAILSFSCIQCGLCTSRCMGELPQYHIAQLARRMHGGKMVPRAQHVAEAVQKANDAAQQKKLKELTECDEKTLAELYQAREIEPEMAGEDWVPSTREYL